ncbi:hypothetical protein [Shewanella youngdeokensis]|uniref:DUF4402 domain-containing protein n=1 Tax=Shewanella youngdeokensis TaxID=2999068 RepID=A0ABZ0K294_9GAMM|nr:hypothetical protein RGE70_07885 [Shewanella sp. DAU334]
MLLTTVLATTIGQANFNLVLPVNISQVSAIQMGEIYNQQHGTCKLTTMGRIGDACAESVSTLGKISLQGSKGSPVQINVKSATNGYVQFTPILSNGSQTLSITLNDDTAVYVGGELKVLSTNKTGHMDIDYVVEINYQ